jgi:uncharacterized protein with PIN domain
MVFDMRLTNRGRVADTSALIAMLEQEPEAERIARALASTPESSRRARPQTASSAAFAVIAGRPFFDRFDFHRRGGARNDT